MQPCARPSQCRRQSWKIVLQYATAPASRRLGGAAMASRRSSSNPLAVDAARGSSRADCRAAVEASCCNPVVCGSVAICRRGSRVPSARREQSIVSSAGSVSAPVERSDSQHHIDRKQAAPGPEIAELASHYWRITTQAAAPPRLRFASVSYRPLGIIGIESCSLTSALRKHESRRLVVSPSVACETLGTSTHPRALTGDN
jgi:hypothetical protein